MTSLKKLRLSKDLTQEELAELSGVSQATIVRHEAERLSINRETANLIASALEVDVDELFKRSQLSHRGRPPATGTPLSGKSYNSEHLCSDCYLIHRPELPCS